MPAQYPLLGGQYAEYIAAQLKAFRSGERANDPNRMMRVTARMSERDRAVAEHAAGCAGGKSPLGGSVLPVRPMPRLEERKL